MKTNMRSTLLLAFLVGVNGRCPNDCSGKGVCNAGSVCECYSNYMGNDCSQRVCNFGKAFVDTPIGDINGNGMLDTDQQVYLSFSNSLVGEMYDPNYALARTNNTVDWDEAHFYAECSNKGVCNRKTGICDCFPGFEGEGCRRASCPLDCNGRGRCILLEDEHSDYTLWDLDKTQKCVCDPGYTGPDCSQRECPSGPDPVEYPYSDLDVVYKLDWAPQTGVVHDNHLPNGNTLFTLTYTDNFGDTWTTKANTMHYQIDCSAGGLADGVFDPQTLPSSTCTAVPFVANPYFPDSGMIGSVVHQAFLDPFFRFQNGSDFLYDEDFVGEQVNNTLKNLPNDLLRAPYVWTAYNPVVRATDFANDLLQTGKVSFLYPSGGTVDFVAATGGEDGTGNYVGELDGSGDLIDPVYGWSICQADPSNSFCAPEYDFSDGPSKAVDDPNYRFPSFYSTKGVFGAYDENSAPGHADEAAFRYLGDCDLYHVCIWIKLPGPLGTRSLTVNYDYKPTLLIQKDPSVTRTGTDDADQLAALSDYDVFYGVVKHGFVSVDGTTGHLPDASADLLTLSSVSSDRIWLARDGTPTIDFPDQSTINSYVCSKRGLCDYDTGKCECFFGYIKNDCSVRTPSEIQNPF